jgi:chromosome segregation ATPase
VVVLKEPWCAAELTQAGLRKACADLKKSVRDTDKEATESENRIRQLEEERARAGDEIEGTAAGVHHLRTRQVRSPTNVLKTTVNTFANHPFLCGNAARGQICQLSFLE